MKTILTLLTITLFTGICNSQSLIFDGTILTYENSHSYSGTTTKIENFWGGEIEASKQVYSELFAGFGVGFSKGKDDGSWLYQNEPFSVEINKFEIFGSVKYIFLKDKKIRPFVGLRFKYRTETEKRSGTLT